MKRACDLIDRYRDGDLDPALKAEFECHLESCTDCRRALALLNHLVQILRPMDQELPSGTPERIARRAFDKAGHWDAMVVFWLRPGPAWVALAFCLILTGIMWFAPRVRPVDAYSEYEIMSSETAVAGAQVQTDEDFATWVEEGGLR
jgi:anti-sigma factor RsiW